MAEILKRGNDAEPTYDLACHGCLSTVRFKRSEGRYVSDQHDGDAIIFKCPVCSTESWVAAELVK